MRRTQANIDVEEILKNENPEDHDYIFRIGIDLNENREKRKKRKLGFVRYKCGSDSENPIFDDELKEFQIYTEVSTVENDRS